MRKKKTALIAIIDESKHKLHFLDMILRNLCDKLYFEKIY